MTQKTLTLTVTSTPVVGEEVRDNSPFSIIVEQKDAAGNWNVLMELDGVTNAKDPSTALFAEGQRVIIQPVPDVDAVYDPEQAAAYPPDAVPEAARERLGLKDKPHKGELPTDERPPHASGQPVRPGATPTKEPAKEYKPSYDSNPMKDSRDVKGETEHRKQEVDKKDDKKK